MRTREYNPNIHSEGELKIVDKSEQKIYNRVKEKHVVILKLESRLYHAL
jgi:hypothetical protein